MNVLSGLSDKTLQCTAMSRQSGERCKRRPHPGSMVCVMHGARAPQVKQKARERLEALVDPAIKTLHLILKKGLDEGNAQSAVRAALGILDRCGFHPTQSIELYGKDGGPVEIQASTIPVESLSFHVKRLILFELNGGQVSNEVVEMLMREVDQKEVSGANGQMKVIETTATADEKLINHK